MRKLAGNKKAFGPLIIVVIAAALAVFGFNWWNARAAAKGGKPLGGMVYAVLLVVAGLLSFSVKRLKVAAAPLLMVGGVLFGFEAVRSFTPMSGSRYRLGQGRPANVGISRPASVATGAPMTTPISTGRAAWRNPGTPARNRYV